MSITELNSDILNKIIKLLDIKSIKNLFYSSRKFKFTDNERIEILFMDRLKYIIKNNNIMNYIKYNIPFIRNIKISYIPKSFNIINGLTLTHLDFSDSDFNEPLYDSLLGLPLTDLHLGRKYDHPLYFLNNMEEEISCFKGLPLINLHLGHNFNQPLKNSLKDCKLLTNLRLSNNYDQPLNDSLINCKSLNNLNLGFSYNKHVFYNIFSKKCCNKLVYDENCCENSVNEYIIKSFSCFEGLPLTDLKLGGVFNKRLYFLKRNVINDQIIVEEVSCLEGLPLDTLNLGNKFNKPLQFLNRFTNKEVSCLRGLPLYILYLGDDFFQPLGNSLNGLPLLYLNLGSSYDYPLGNSLSGLPLKTLFVGRNYRHPLYDSLVNINTLSEIIIHENYSFNIMGQNKIHVKRYKFIKNKLKILD